jgi:penicillin-insensitive murein endopeptidase
MQALLEASGVVQRIFIAEHLRTLLLAEARRSRPPPRILKRFEQVTCQPSTPHDDHMHVRFYCSAEDIQAGCMDSHPIYPWRRQELRALGIEPVPARWSRQQRKRTRARTTTPAQARRRAGRMHRRVRQFLDRRKAWQEKPSPGRPFCP